MSMLALDLGKKVEEGGVTVLRKFYTVNTVIQVVSMDDPLPSFWSLL